MRAFFVFTVLSLVFVSATQAADVGGQVDALLQGLGSDDAKALEQSQAALFTLVANASRPGAEEERAAVCKAIAERLPKPNPKSRVWLLHELRRCGRAECVPAVATQLADKDPHVREAARCALAANPASSATHELCKALKDAQGVWLIGLINALGMRAGNATDSVQPLLKQLSASDENVRAAAAAALAKIGDKRALEPVVAATEKGSARTQNAITDSALLLCDQLCMKGEKATTRSVYKKFYENGKGHVKCAGLIGLGRSGGAAELQTILTAMAHADPRLRGAAFEAILLTSPKEATPALLAKLERAPANLKTTILRALTTLADPSAKEGFLTCVADTNEHVRMEALRGLGKVGDGSVVPVLAKATVAGGPSGDTARRSLDGLQAGDVNDALVKMLKDPGPKLRAEAARSLGARHATSAVPALLRAGEDKDSNARNAALKALSGLAKPDHVDALVRLAASSSDQSTRDTAIAAITAASMSNPDQEKRAVPIVAGYANASAQGKLVLLTVLGRLGGTQALDTLKKACSDPNEEVQKAAVRALGEWPDLSAAETLLGLARNAKNEILQVLAIRGYIRLAALGNKSEALKICQTALETAKRPDEKRLALKSLGETGNSKALQIMLKYVDDPNLGNEACAGIVRACSLIKGRRNASAAKAALEKVVSTTQNKGIKKGAEKLLRDSKRWK